MSKLIKAKIDVTKIDKKKLFQGAKGTYLDVDIWIDETEPEAWKQVSLNQSQSQEDREAGLPKNYIGNGECKWGWDNQSVSQPQSQPGANPMQDVPAPSNDEIPF
jgi:hypothetical protein